MPILKEGKYKNKFTGVIHEIKLFKKELMIKREDLTEWTILDPKFNHFGTSELIF